VRTQQGVKDFDERHHKALARAKAPGAEVTRTTPITLRAGEIKLAQLLQLVLDESWPTKAPGFELKDGTITISTAPGEKDPPPHPKDKSAAAGKQGL
jgi:hypothetical protein